VKEGPSTTRKGGLKRGKGGEPSRRGRAKKNSTRWGGKGEEEKKGFFLRSSLIKETKKNPEQGPRRNITRGGSAGLGNDPKTWGKEETPSPERKEKKRRGWN